MLNVRVDEVLGATVPTRTRFLMPVYDNSEAMIFVVDGYYYNMTITRFEKDSNGNTYEILPWNPGRIYLELIYMDVQLKGHEIKKVSKKIHIHESDTVSLLTEDEAKEIMVIFRYLMYPFKVGVHVISMYKHSPNIPDSEIMKTGKLLVRTNNFHEFSYHFYCWSLPEDGFDDWQLSFFDGNERLGGVEEALLRLGAIYNRDEIGVVSYIDPETGDWVF